MSFGRDDRQQRKISPVPGHIPAEQTVPFHHRMSANVEVRQRRASISAGAAILNERMPGGKSSLPRQMFSMKKTRRKRRVRLFTGGETCSHFSIDQRIDQQWPIHSGDRQLLGRPFRENARRMKHVYQDICIDKRRHRFNLAVDGRIRRQSDHRATSSPDVAAGDQSAHARDVLPPLAAA